MVQNITTEILYTEIQGLGKKIDGPETRFGGLENRFNGLESRFDDLEYATKEGFDEQGRRLDHLERGQDDLKHMVAKNGDALANLTNRFEAESAANQNHFQRIETRLDHAGAMP